MPEQAGITTAGEVGSVAIGDFNKDEFGPANSSTSGNFSGFEIGPSYRIYIQYFDGAGTSLNGAAEEELSDFAYPMVQASPPTVSSFDPALCQCTHLTLKFCLFLIRTCPQHLAAT